MCPICALTTVAIVSGSASAGGLSTFLLRKTWTRSRSKAAKTGVETEDAGEPSECGTACATLTICTSRNNEAVTSPFNHRHIGEKNPS